MPPRWRFGLESISDYLPQIRHVGFNSNESPRYHDTLPPRPEPTLESLAAELYIVGNTITDLREELQHINQQLAETTSRLDHTQDIQSIEGLLNHYTALHDDAVFDLAKRKEWEDLFATDGVAVYPFGTHTGRSGKGDWAFGSVSYFERCQLLSSNFDISFSTDKKKAHVRSNCIAQWVKKKDMLGEHFDEGGFYYWTLRKEDEKWVIEHVHLTITWTMGEDPSGVGPVEGRQGKERGGGEEKPYGIDRG